MSAPKWAPHNLLDADVPHLLAQPSDWLRIVPGGHALLNSQGEVPADEDPEEAEGERLADGELIMMERQDSLGDATLTIFDADEDEDGEPFTVSRSMPHLATDAWIVGEEDTYPTVEQMVDDFVGWPGEYSIRYVRWTTHRFRYRAETGTLEPEDPASLAPLPEEPDAPLPLFGGAQP
jgi:hypothetical protein